MPSFNLVTQPWVTVVRRNRTTVTVSLAALLSQWDDFLEIQAESPPTTYAIYRLVLAILHSAYRGPADPADWRRIWKDNGKEAIAYLHQWSDRFDLLDADRPFMQDPALPPESAAPFYVALLSQPDATPAHFCTLHRYSGYQPDEAAIARCIVRVQSMDLAGLKTGYPGDSGRSAIASPIVNVANVLVQGASLRETLCLNLVRYVPQPGDRPAWELDDGYAGEPRTAVVPTGALHYRTMAWRRVRWAEGRGIVVTPGDRLDPQVDITTLESAVAFRRDEKLGIRPVRISPDRAVWRDAHAFLRAADETTRPMVLDWISELADEGLVHEPLNLAVFGWSADKAKSLGWHQETLTVAPQWLRDPTAWAALKGAVRWADACGQVFRAFRGSPYGNLAEALRHPDAAVLAGSGGGGRQYWARLGAQVPLLLEAIANGTFSDETWRRDVRIAARQSFHDSIQGVQDRRARAIALNSLNYWLYKKIEEQHEAAGRGD